MWYLRALFPARLLRCHERRQFILELALLSASLILRRFVPLAVIDRRGREIPQVVDDHISFCTLDHRPALTVPARRAGQDSHPVILVLQHDAELAVHPRRSKNAARLDPLDLVPEYHGGEIQEKIAQVSKSSSAERRALHPREFLHIRGDIRREHNGRAYRAARNDAYDLFKEREKTGMDRFYDQDVKRCRKREQALGISGSKSDRRFAKHGLSSLDADPHLFRVFRGGRRDIDQIDFLVVQHLFHRIVCLLISLLSPELKGSVQVP